MPSLIPHKAQKELLSKLLHRDLADLRHKTNLHLHHRLPYQATLPEIGRSFDTDVNSFFNMSPESSELFLPINAEVHKPLNISQFLCRKLRWLTLGGQYNWTEKRYPAEEPPLLPEDVARFVHTLFPCMKPEAAILNVYTPGDTLSIHRDVSEESDNALVSISIGCDGLFVAGLDTESKDDSSYLVVRLRSGDAVLMSGQARFAWHGIPQIIPDTCPPGLRDWPAISASDDVEHAGKGAWEAWRGWMSNKRINLNVRQMRD